MVESEYHILKQTIKQILLRPWHIYHWGKRKDIKMFLDLLITRDFTEANRRRMNRRVRNNPKEAIGGWENEIGELQFDFLHRRGLSPESRLLDIGCGTLRGGRYYIEYLNSANYTGVDISKEAIKSGKDLVSNEILNEKQPELLVNTDLKFSEIPNNSIDYAIAQSVFTHLPENDIRECFEHIREVLVDGGVLYATFYESECTEEEILTPSSFKYSPETLTGIAAEYNLKSKVLDKERYPHPHGQRMLEIVNEIQ